MTTATSSRPHRRKERIPPGEAAKAAAAQLRQIRNGATATDTDSSTPTNDSTVIDLSVYERAAQKRTLQ